MPFTESDISQIRRYLPKNYRQKIVQKCAESGTHINARIVSLVLSNRYQGMDTVLAVTDAIAALIKEQKAAEARIQKKLAESLK